MSATRRAFFRNQLPTSVDEDQNAAVAALIARVTSVEGRATGLESDVATKAAAADLAAEVAAREAALAAEVAAREAALAAEVAAREAVIADLSGAVAAEVAARGVALADLSGVIAAEVAARGVALADLATQLEDSIEAEALARVDSINNEVAARDAAIEARATLLLGDISTVESALAVEVGNRVAAVSAEASARAAAISAEAAARTSGLAAKADTSMVASTYQTKTDAASRVTAENSFLTAFKDAIFLEGQANTDVEFNYTTLLSTGGSGGSGGSSPTPFMTVGAARSYLTEVLVAYTSTSGGSLLLRNMSSGMNMGAPNSIVVSGSSTVLTLNISNLPDGNYAFVEGGSTVRSNTFAIANGSFGNQTLLPNDRMTLYAAKQYAEGARIIFNSTSFSPNSPVQHTGAYNLRRISDGTLFTGFDTSLIEVNFIGFDNRGNNRVLLSNVQLENNVQYVFVNTAGREITRRFALTGGQLGTQTYLD